MKKIDRFRVYTYDIWGNEEGGFEVNDIFMTSEYVTLSDNMTDAEILHALEEEGIIISGIDHEKVEIDGEFDYALYFSYDDRPEFELRRIRGKE